MHHDHLTVVTFNDKSQTRNGKCLISDLSFGLPPFGRVPSFGLRIADLGGHGAWGKRFDMFDLGYLIDFNDLNWFYDSPLTAHCLLLTAYSRLLATAFLSPSNRGKSHYVRSQRR